MYVLFGAKTAEGSNVYDVYDLHVCALYSKFDKLQTHIIQKTRFVRTL